MIQSHRRSLAHNRKLRVRGKLRQSLARPRLTVFRSNKYTYLQVIDDTTGNVIAGVTTRSFEGGKKDAGVTKLAAATKAAAHLAELLLAKKVTAVTLDRGSYRYHGRVKAVAEAMRAGKVQL